MSEKFHEQIPSPHANGRGMTSGLFQAYAGAAQDMASTSEERDAIAASYEKIHALMSPLLTLDPAAVIETASAPSRLAAISKLVRVRVEAS